MSFDSLHENIKQDFILHTQNYADKSIQHKKIIAIYDQLVKIKNYSDLKLFFARLIIDGDADDRYFAYVLYLIVKDIASEDMVTDEFKPVIRSIKNIFPANNEFENFATVILLSTKMCLEKEILSLDKQDPSRANKRYILRVFKANIELAHTFGQLLKALLFLLKNYKFDYKFVVSILAIFKKRITEYQSPPERFTKKFNALHDFFIFWEKPNGVYKRFCQFLTELEQAAQKNGNGAHQDSQSQKTLDKINKIRSTLDKFKTFTKLKKYLKDFIKINDLEYNYFFQKLCHLIKTSVDTPNELKEFINRLLPASESYQTIIAGKITEFQKQITGKITSLKAVGKPTNLLNGADEDYMLLLIETNLRLACNFESLLRILPLLIQHYIYSPQVITDIFSGIGYAIAEHQETPLLLDFIASFNTLRQFFLFWKQNVDEYTNFLAREKNRLKSKLLGEANNVEKNEENIQRLKEIDIIISLLSSVHDYAGIIKVIKCLRENISFYNALYRQEFFITIHYFITPAHACPEELKKSVNDIFDTQKNDFMSYWTPILKETEQAFDEFCKNKNADQQQTSKRVFSTLKFIENPRQLIETIKLLIFHKNSYTEFNDIFFNILLKSKHAPHQLIENINELISFDKFWQALCQDFTLKHGYNPTKLCKTPKHQTVTTFDSFIIFIMDLKKTRNSADKSSIDLLFSFIKSQCQTANLPATTRRAILELFKLNSPTIVSRWSPPTQYREFEAVPPLPTTGLLTKFKSSPAALEAPRRTLNINPPTAAAKTDLDIHASERKSTATNISSSASNTSAIPRTLSPIMETAGPQDRFKTTESPSHTCLADEIRKQIEADKAAAAKQSSVSSFSNPLAVIAAEPPRPKGP